MNSSIQSAGFWIRTLASVVDTAVVVAVTWGLALVLIRARDPSDVQDSIIGLYLILSAAYHLGFWLKWEATPGKGLFGLRVVRADDGEKISLLQGVLRWVGYGLSMMIFGAGYLMAAFQPQKRAIHDLLAGTRVIRKR